MGIASVFFVLFQIAALHFAVPFLDGKIACSVDPRLVDLAHESGQMEPVGGLIFQEQKAFDIAQERISDSNAVLVPWPGK